MQPDLMLDEAAKDVLFDEFMHFYRQALRNVKSGCSTHFDQPKRCVIYPTTYVDSHSYRHSGIYSTASKR